MCERMLPSLWGICFSLMMMLSPVLGVPDKMGPKPDFIFEKVTSNNYSHTSESTSFTTGRVGDAVTQEISNGAVTQDVSDVAVIQGVSDLQVTQDISGVEVTQEISNGAVAQDVSDVVRAQEISSVAVTQDTSNVIVTQEISSVSMTQDFTDVVWAQEVSSVAVTQDVSDVVRAQKISSVAVTQDTSNVIVTQKISSLSVTQEISNGAVTQDVNNVAETQEISSMAVTQDTSNATVAQEISNVSVFQENSNGAVNQNVSDVAVTQHISDVTVTQEISSIPVTQGSSSVTSGDPRVLVAHRGPFLLGFSVAEIQSSMSVLGVGGSGSPSPHENVTTVSPVQCSDKAIFTTETIEDICEGTVSEWSCNGICGYRRELPCSCDVTCLLHQTCCNDFKELCPDLASLAKEELDQFPGISTVCEPRFGALMVADCPNNVTTEEKRLCRAENPTSLRDEVPVVDTLNNWHFKNVHCWKCWKTQGQAVLWTANIFMNELYQAEDDYSYSFHTIRQYMTENHLRVEWLPPDFTVKAHCSDTVISTCPRSCVSDQNIVNQCEEGTHSYFLEMSLFIGEKQKYKNHYCYLCNLKNQITEKKRCAVPQSLGQKPNRHEMFFSITMVFPPEEEEEIELINNDNRIGSYPWTSLACSETDGICQIKACSEDSINIDGRCDASIAPVQYTIQLCSLDVGADTCKTGLTFQEMFNTDLEDVKEWMRETVTGAIFQSDRPFNQTVIDVLVYDTHDKGLVVTAITKVKKEFSEEAQKLSPHVEMLFHNKLEVSRAVGPIIACINVGQSKKVEFLPYTGTTCHKTAVCGSAPP